jgi:hypothetical protein
MYVHELLMRARQDELLRAAAQHRLAADFPADRPAEAGAVKTPAGAQGALTQARTVHLLARCRSGAALLDAWQRRARQSQVRPVAQARTWQERSLAGSSRLDGQNARHD